MDSTSESSHTSDPTYVPPESRKKRKRNSVTAVESEEDAMRYLDTIDDIINWEELGPNASIADVRALINVRLQQLAAAKGKKKEMQPESVGFSKATKADLDAVGLFMPDKPRTFKKSWYDTLDRKFGQDFTFPLDEDMCNAALKILKVLPTRALGQNEMASRLEVALVLFLIGEGRFDLPDADESQGDRMAARPLYCVEFPVSGIEMSKLDNPEENITFGGKLDHLIVHFHNPLARKQLNALGKGDLDVIGDHEHGDQILILETKSKGLRELSSLRRYHAQLMIEASATCKALKLKDGIRGCLSDGESWAFFIYSVNDQQTFKGYLDVYKPITINTKTANVIKMRELALLFHCWMSQKGQYKPENHIRDK